MTKCLSLDGLFRWAAAPTAVDTTTTRTLLSVDATVLFQSTSTSPDAHQLPRHYCMVSSSSKRRSTGARTSLTGGPSEALSVLVVVRLLYFFAFDLPVIWNKNSLALGFANLLLCLEGCMSWLFDEHGTRVPNQFNSNGQTSCGPVFFFLYHCNTGIPRVLCEWVFQELSR